jgi:hypothetical protein
MSQVLIDTYRGWEISFDIENESFYCHSDRWDREQTKVSFAATKKFIDDFIKENTEFKPFVIEPLPSCYEKELLKVIGIRKDGVFMVEGRDGKKRQLSLSDEKKYILRNVDNDKFRQQAKDLDVEMDKLRKEQNEILAKVTGVSLVDFKKTLI